MIRRPPRSTQSRSSAASDVYKRQLYSFEPILDGCPGGQHYHRNITGLGVLAHCSTDFRAVDARHHHIKDDYVRSEILYRIQGLESVRCLVHLELVLGKRFNDQPAKGLVVISNQDFWPWL